MSGLISEIGGIHKAISIVSGAPDNAESYQNGYYIREKPQFMFHNGFHSQWNLTTNNGEWFKNNGVNIISLNDLSDAIDLYFQELNK